MKLNSHTADLRLQTKNQAHSRPSPSSLGMCFVKNQIASALWGLWAWEPHIYCCTSLLRSSTLSPTCLCIHWAFNLVKQIPEQWSGISCACCWKASLHKCACMFHVQCPHTSKNLVRAQMIFHSSYLALTPSPSPFSSLLNALSFGPTFSSPSPTPSTMTRSKRGWHPTSVCGYSATPQSK